jgi:hypothetical protein
MKIPRRPARLLLAPFSLALWIGSGALALAQEEKPHTAHDHAAMHAAMTGAAAATAPATDGPRAAGEAVFEAIEEVVRLLESDPETDWSRVDVDALRAHLVDMDALFSRAEVAAEEIPGGARFRVTGSAAARDAAGRMVPAHARMMGHAATGWSWTARQEGEAVVLEVTGDGPGAEQRIRGLGFFGLMASGDHHRVHHLAIARGEDVHAH